MGKTRCLALLALGLPAVGAAQDDRPVMSIVDMLNVPELASPQLSPDGQSLVFEVDEADWNENRQITHLGYSGATAKPSRSPSAKKTRPVRPGHPTAATLPSCRSAATTKKRKSSFCRHLAARRVD